MAQMRGRDHWSDVTIRNISPHGMLLLGSSPPRPGDYIEIRKASLVLVGRAVWVNGKAFGVRLIERLNFTALLKAANDSFAASQVRAPQEHRTQPAPIASLPSAVNQPDGPTTQAVTWIVAAGFFALAVVCATLESL
ncbi:hypothetical protein P1X14_04705 [Sphingomonas sp. AOB5]|uniref:hypothetical protein n=1 Tax=Sphingomonas sp. AOB5 TaxID=3034017 RepID=UPI0023F77EFA|nr:hypothetical protein [Sphingomonas sp. AOB5]MDF7774537.1 hypothetical protein [Sphingomonas sp. AOB5]